MTYTPTVKVSRFNGVYKNITNTTMEEWLELVMQAPRTHADKTQATTLATSLQQQPRPIKQEKKSGMKKQQLSNGKSEEAKIAVTKAEFRQHARELI